MRTSSPAAVFELKVKNAETNRTEHHEIKFCVARLDNRNELISELSLDEKATDADIILAVYIDCGSDCANRLLGDFAFAIWDSKKKYVYAARDFIGCQPVYYSVAQQNFFVAENLDQLLKNPMVSRDLDEPYIAACLKQAFAHSQRTSFSKIRKIPPGHYLIVDNSKTSVNCYWRPEDVQPRKWKSHDDCLTEFRKIVRQAVVDRLPKSGGTGVHVSGGLDCSSLAIIASQELAAKNQQKPLALTWYPAPQDDHSAFEKSEYDRIRSVCGIADLEPIYTTPSGQNIIDVLNRDSMIHPICNASYNEKLVLDEAEKNGVTTIISGFGGDEAASFDGRGYFQGLALRGKWLKLSKLAKDRRRNPLGFLVQMLSLGLSHTFFSESRLSQFETSLHEKKWDAWKALVDVSIRRFERTNQTEKSDASTIVDFETQSYLNKDIENQVDALPPIKIVRMPNSRAARCNLLRWEANGARIESWAADGAQRGIKYVYPLLDRRVVEFSLSLPGSVFRDSKYKRLFYRQAMEPILPSNVCWETAKTDPARADPMIASIREAFSILGEQLSGDIQLPSKSRYLDMERLMADLREEKIQHRERLGRIIQAMEFLGTGFLKRDRQSK